MPHRSKTTFGTLVSAFLKLFMTDIVARVADFEKSPGCPTVSWIIVCLLPKLFSGLPFRHVPVNPLGFKERIDTASWRYLKARVAGESRCLAHYFWLTTSMLTSVAAVTAELSLTCNSYGVVFALALAVAEIMIRLVPAII